MEPCPDSARRNSERQGANGVPEAVGLPHEWSAVGWVERSEARHQGEIVASMQVTRLRRAIGPEGERLPRVADAMLEAIEPLCTDPRPDRVGGQVA